MLDILWERRRESLDRRATCETTQNRIGEPGSRISISCNRVGIGRRAKQEPPGTERWPVAVLGTRYRGENGRSVQNENMVRK